MYGRSRTVLLGLSGLLVACTLASIAVIAVIDKGAKSTSIISMAGLKIYLP